jgi:putative tricarboxylic transport membrane protein
MYYHWASQLSPGTLSRPGPGVWPSIVALVMIVICVIAILESLLKQEEGKTAHIELPIAMDRRRAVLFIALMVGYILSLRYLGFLWPSIAVVILSMRVLADSKWWKASILAVVSVGITYYGFIELFETRFPRGSLIRTLGG